MQWLGHVNDDEKLRSLWQHAGAYFHGHSVGGTNPALVQAMASGAPTVARDTTYNRETLAQTGTFVRASTDAIVRGIETMMQSPEQDQLARAAKDRAAQDYSWDGVCAAYEEALVKLIDEKRR